MKTTRSPGCTQEELPGGEEVCATADAAQRVVIQAMNRKHQAVRGIENRSVEGGIPSMLNSSREDQVVTVRINPNPIVLHFRSKSRRTGSLFRLRWYPR